MTEPDPSQAAAYKPRIDAALARIAGYTGADPEDLARTLAGIDIAELGPWGYLMAALRAGSDLLLSDEVAAALKREWFLYFLEAREEEFLPPRFGGDSEGDDDHDSPELEDDGYADTRRALYLEDYPEEAHEALEQAHFVGGSGRGVVCLWRREGGATSVCFASPRGFEILGEDPADFAERAAALLESPRAASEASPADKAPRRERRRR
jgi:hypothetical protein